MSYSENYDYLVRCVSDDGDHYYAGRVVDAEFCPTCGGSNLAPNLLCPGSRYGYRSGTVAVEVIRAARMSGDTSQDNLDHLMSDAVNDGDRVQEIIREFAIAQSGANVDDMVQGYLECQLWAQHVWSEDPDAEAETLSDAGYGVDDIADEYVDNVREEIINLIVAHPLAIRMYLNRKTTIGVQRNVHNSAQFGHDFYLTREHHGAGFWDRGLGDLGRHLTDVSHWAGPAADLDVDEFGRVS